jgi:UDP-glucose 4-epimerase
MKTNLENFDGKNVLITGGLGFIGSNLAGSLVEGGAKVTLVDSLIPEYGGNLWNIDAFKDKVRVNISDIRDETSVRYWVQNQDYIFNLAGQTSHLDSMRDPYTDLDINTRAQIFILEACRHYNPEVRLVFAGTRQVYGIPQYLPVDEKHPLHPVDMNGVNKLAGEWYHAIYSKVYGIRSTILRLTNTYGPRMRVRDARQTFLGIWIRQLLDGETIQVFGDGQQVRDFNYVEDVKEAMLIAALQPTAVGKIYNIGAPDAYTLQEVAEMMVPMKKGGAYQLVPFPADRKAIDIGDYRADYQLIQRELGWTPQILLKEGLQKTVEYYWQHLEHYR